MQNSDDPAAGLVSHNVTIGTRRASFRLENLIWRALHEIAQRQKITSTNFARRLQRASRGCFH
jgi:predicted DNA-binding ribbon-helix-helix protein